MIIDQGRVVASGAVDDLTTRGRPRLVVRVAGDRDGAWARGLAGVTVSENDGGALRLILADPAGARATGEAPPTRSRCCGRPWRRDR